MSKTAKTCIRLWLDGILGGTPTDTFCENCLNLSKCFNDPAWQDRTMGEARDQFPCLRKDSSGTHS